MLTRPVFLLSCFALLCGIFTPGHLGAQNRKIDSLLAMLKVSQGDTNEVNTLNEIGRELTNTGNYPKARNYAEQAKILADRLSWQKGIGDYHSNLGIICYYEGNYSEALKNHFEALRIREKIGDKKGIAGSYNNIAVIYNYQKKHSEALIYLMPALKIKEELGDIKGAVSTYNNIGLTYSDMKNHPEAMKYFSRSLALSEETGNKKGVANAYHNIGSVYYQQELYDTALVYFLRGLEIRESIGYRQGVVSSLISAGMTAMKLENYRDAHSRLERALELATEIREKEGIKNSSDGLWQLAEAEGDYDNAFRYYKLYRETQDEMFSEENTRKAMRAEMNYTYEKERLIEKNKRDKDEARLKEEANKREQAVWFISGILVLVLVFAVFAYRSLLQKRTANRELDLKNQKLGQAYKIIENKNREITDSINYAQRIQQAILPPREAIAAAFPESFVFYKPKDIVGGDFYYLSVKNGGVFVAVADCTGHGVPGAFMSLIGSKELGLANGVSGSPGKILQLLNRGLKETLKQNNLEGTKDGMDIALARIESNVIRFSGANRPLWLIRAGAARIEETAPTKTAIGGFTPDEQVFGEHSLPLSKGDTIYIFTDGYADQFGGSSGKKLSKKKFREFLLSVNSSPMQEQARAIEQYYDAWKGEQDQLDDILVIGIRI